MKRCAISIQFVTAWLGAVIMAVCLAGEVAPAGTIALWRMESTGIENPRVLDGEIDEAVQNLWSLNSAANSFATSGDTPPASLRFRPEGGGVSYDASALSNSDGALLYPANTYGNVFNFSNAFTVQLFFKTHGDKSADGIMQLLLQGHTSFRYGVTVNDPSSGHVRFTLRDSSGASHFADLAVRNYADGAWHYLYAAYDPATGMKGSLKLTVVNQDGSSETSITPLPNDFPGLRVGSDGNLQIGRNSYLKTQTPRTFLGLIDEVMVTEGVASGTNLVGALPGPVARWNMTPAGGNLPAVLDTINADGANHLITFNEAGNIYPVSGEVPPASLLANGHTGGSHAFNAAMFAGMAGALFYPQDLYGNVFSFTGGFSLELFFKSDGDRSGAGLMQLMMQGENFFRFGIIVNEPGPGNVRFAINDGVGHIPLADLTARNYADGQWHYLVAKYLPHVGAKGTLTLGIANTDGTMHSVVTAIDSAFVGLPAGNDGNLFLGRNIFGLDPNSRVFMGLIDEVQISRGAPAAGSQRLGVVPPPAVTSAVKSAGGFALHWSAQPGETCVVEYVESLDATPVHWTPVSSQLMSTSTGTFTDTDATRLARPTGFYRVVLQ